MNLLKNRNWNCNSKICFGGTCAYFICLNVSIYYIYSCNYITLLFYLCLKRILSLLIIVLLLCVVVLLKISRTSDLMKLKTLNFLISKFFIQSNPLQLSYFLLLPSFALWKLNNIMMVIVVIIIWLCKGTTVCACSVVHSCPTLQYHGLQPARLLCSWDSPGKDTRVSGHFLLQWIFLIQRLNKHLLCRLHWQADSFNIEQPGRLQRHIYFLLLKLILIA